MKTMGNQSISHNLCILVAVIASHVLLIRGAFIIHPGLGWMVVGATLHVYATNVYRSKAK